ncbi:MAG: flagellar brake protein [Gammaproteobacteria bacterium]|nr:flagellar brake protein [Gammaproteobacteria bacterium]
MFQTIQREQAPLFLFFSDDVPIKTRIKHVDEVNHSLVLGYTDEMLTVQHINASGVFLVVDHAHTQVQFHVDGFAQQTSGPQGDYLIDLPNSLYLIQRRNSLRRPIPDQDKVVCRLESSHIDTTSFTVLDISDKGMALLDQDGRIEAEEGESFDAVLTIPGHDIKLILTLANRFTIYIPEGNRRMFRIGCTLSGMSEQAQASLAQYLSKLNYE